MNSIYTVIENANLVLETGILWDGVIVVQNDRIVDFGTRATVEIPSGAKHYDAHGAYVGPGFIDLHVHGGNGFSTCSEPVKAAEFFLRHGATSILATPDYSMTLATFLDSIRTIKAAIPTAKTIRGMYLEGPYMNPNYGCNSHINPWRHPIDPTEFKQLVDEAGEFATVWAIAPEREGLLPFLKYARQVNPNTLFAVGHSEARPDQIRALGTAFKPRLQTHSMNATGRQPVGGGLRGYGPDEYAWQEPDVYTELISDSLAVHVHPDMQRLLLHTKGLHRVVLITDSTVFDGSPAPQYAHVTDLSFDACGDIAGSRITMNQACRNVMTHTNCGIAQAFIMASLNPARAIGIDCERGSIERDKIADLVFVNDRFDVKDVMLGGEICNFD